MPSKKPSGSTKFPPSLARAESEFKKLCNELGGPADIGITVDKNYMEVCCREYRVGLLLPILLRFQKNEAVARRHWPWAAIAISQYAFERAERAIYAYEQSPNEILEILGQIIKAARDLGSGLAQLQALSSRKTIHPRLSVALTSHGWTLSFHKPSPAEFRPM